MVPGQRLSTTTVAGIGGEALTEAKKTNAEVHDLADAANRTG